MLDSIAEALATIEKSKCVSPTIFLQSVKDHTRVISASPTSGSVVVCIVPGSVAGLTGHVCIDKGTFTSAIQGRGKAVIKVLRDQNALQVQDKDYKALIPFTDSEEVPTVAKPEGKPTFVMDGKNAKTLLSLVNKCGIERVHESQPDPNIVVEATIKATKITSFDEMQMCSLKGGSVFAEPTKFLCPMITLQTVLGLPFQTARFWVTEAGVTVATPTWTVVVPSLAEGVASGDTVTQKLKEVLSIKCASSVEIPTPAVQLFLGNTSGIYQTGALYQFTRNDKGLSVLLDGAKGKANTLLSKKAGKATTFGLHRSFLTFLLTHETEQVTLDLADGLAILRGENLTYVAALAQ